MSTQVADRGKPPTAEEIAALARETGMTPEQATLGLYLARGLSRGDEIALDEHGRQVPPQEPSAP
jgi:hypothetical protein